VRHLVHVPQTQPTRPTLVQKNRARARCWLASEPGAIGHTSPGVRVRLGLTTERLVLREFEEDDWRAVLAYQSDPRYLRFYPWTERSEASVREFVGGFLARQKDKPRRVFQVAVTLPAEHGRLIGNCGVRVNDTRQREGHIGYELDPDYWGRGYATEAARAVLAYAFEQLKLHRTLAECTADNVASARVLEKLGMRREAHFGEHEHFKRRWWDSLVYAMLDRKWPGVTFA
jgi:[ribosomal protein S5]-alanine N-acetyltransferase